jgi:hypothetical protein
MAPAVFDFVNTGPPRAPSLIHSETPVKINPSGARFFALFLLT